jgi:outer membrane protein assembly factor BamB
MTGTKRYYNGVGSYWTTRCCSAFALIVACVSAATAQQTTVVDQPRVGQLPTNRADPRNDNRNAAFGLFPVTELWNLPLNNLLLAPPAFKDDRGYFPIGDGQLAAYDVRHGTLLWIAPVHAQFQPILGEHLIFVVEPNAIVALRDNTGVEAWRVTLTEPLAAPVTCHNGWLVATTSASGSVLAYRASDGALMWRQDLDALTHAPVAIADNRVYVPMQDSRIIALQVDTGEPVWEHRLGGPPNDILATSDFVYAGSTDNFFYALRVRDGTIAWRWPTGGDVVGLPVADQRLVYFVSFDNVLRALDKNTGNLRWKRPLSFRPTRGLVVMGDAVIASGISRAASAFWMKDGAPLGNLAGAGDELAAQPHPVTGEGFPIVVLTSRDLDRGTVVSTWTRAIEPRVQPIAPLPNPVLPPKAPDLPAAAQDQPADTDRATEDAVMP